LKCGLCDRDGPRDLLNADIDGVGGVALPPKFNDGVLGVSGVDPVDIVGDARFEARLSGRNMPEFGTDVVK
jgi:hypothetical protein